MNSYPILLTEFFDWSSEDSVSDSAVSSKDLPVSESDGEEWVQGY